MMIEVTSSKVLMMNELKHGRISMSIDSLILVRFSAAKNETCPLEEFQLKLNILLF